MYEISAATQAAPAAIKRTRLFHNNTVRTIAPEYAWVAAGWLLPWLRGPLPLRYSAKTVAVLQPVVLILASSDLIPSRQSIRVP